jgi:hypothetical protein
MEDHWLLKTFEEVNEKTHPDDKLPCSESERISVFSIRWHITDDIKESHKIFKETFLVNCKDWVYQLERGEKTDLMHFQGYIETKAKLSTEDWKTCLIRNGVKKFHLSPASKNGMTALKTYCMKPETRVDGPWGKRPIYLGQDLPKSLYPWQKKVEEICEGPIDDRKIDWVYCPKGNIGKSKFCKYMDYHKKGYSLDWGDTKDILYMLAQAGAQRCYLFDLTRTKPGATRKEDIYATLEQLKNGSVVVTKYKGFKLQMESPHCFVFTNEPPDRHRMSDDRWRTWTVNEHLELVPF